jgi:hypothetical protein
MPVQHSAGSCSQHSTARKQSKPQKGEGRLGLIRARESTGKLLGLASKFSKAPGHKTNIFKMCFYILVMKRWTIKYSENTQINI